jgi:nicotinamidase-related amidase
MATTGHTQALIVIDVQEGFGDTAFWGPTANEQAEERIGSLVEHWRSSARGPIVVVRHDSVHPVSPLHAGSDGNRVLPVVAAERADLLVTKTVNSAFYGTPDLAAWLDAAGIRSIVLCGIQSNMCVETTARMAGNLGYDVEVALDATRTFDLRAEVPGLGEVSVTAEELMRVTALNLQAGGFAAVTTTAALLGD